VKKAKTKFLGVKNFRFLSNRKSLNTNSKFKIYLGGLQHKNS